MENNLVSESIEQLFINEAKALEARIGEANQQLKDLSAEESELNAKVQRINKHRSLLKADDLGTESLDKELQIHKDQLSGKQKQAEELKTQIEKLKAERELMNPGLWLLTHVKQVYQQEAAPIDSLNQVFGFLNLDIMLEDGLPVGLRCEIANSRISEDLLIENAEHLVAKTWTPENLSWIPREWLPSATPNSEDSNGRIHANQITITQCPHGKEIPEVFYLEAKHELVPLRNTYSWRTKDTRHYPWRDQWIEQSRTIGDEMETVAAYIEAEVKELGKVVDMKKSNYPAGSLGSFLKRMVEEFTIPREQQSFCFHEGPLENSDSIQKELAPYWNQFAYGPWRARFTGLLANLKYYCEQKERPRFWNLGLKGQYGFRLRTRDHSWIVGQIYVFPKDTETGKPELSGVEITNNERKPTFRVGPMNVTLWEDCDRDRRNR